MGHTYTSNLVHVVFSTKDRQRLISSELQPRLWPYLAGIAQQNDFKALAVGGMEDHVHILLSLPAKLAMAKSVQFIKGGSSKWIHDTFPEHKNFAWQKGYGAFSIGISQLPATVAYIRAQPEHHRKVSFQEEFIRFLKKHGIEYDEQYVWG